METRVPSLTRPIPIARFAERYITIGIVFAEGVFLAASYVLRPIAGMCFFVVKKASNAKLFGGSTIPTSPIPSAGGFVTEYSVEPVAMFSADWGIVSFAAVTVRSMRIVADSNETMTAIARVNEAVRTCPENGLVAIATIQLVVMVAIFFMGQSPVPGFTVGLIEIVYVLRPRWLRTRTTVPRNGIAPVNRDDWVIVFVVVSVLQISPLLS